MIFKFLGYACYAWAAYSLFRFLFIQSDYVGWEWILSIVLELALGSFFLSLSRKRDANGVVE